MVKAGGSSLINGMCYIRGNAMDLEQWATHKGLENWTYADCLPYYKKAETRDIGGNDYHGDSGPVSVATPKMATTCYSMPWLKQVYRQVTHVLTT